MVRRRLLPMKSRRLWIGIGPDHEIKGLGIGSEHIMLKNI